MMNTRYLSSKEVAAILGVNVSTVKRWTEAGRLDAIVTPGGHRKFLLKHLHRFLRDNPRARQKANLLPVDSDSLGRLTILAQKGDYDALRPEFLQAALNCDRSAVQLILANLYLGQQPLYAIFDDLVTPVLYTIGDLWANGELSVGGEHLSTAVIRDAIVGLRSIISMHKNNNTPVLLVSFEDELHDLVLKMIQIILEERGYPVLFSGARTPVNVIGEIIAAHQPQRIYLSSTVVNDISDKQKLLEQVFDLCQDNEVDLFIGGIGFDKLDYDHPAAKKRLLNFQEVAEC